MSASRPNKAAQAKLLHPTLTRRSLLSAASTFFLAGCTAPGGNGSDANAHPVTGSTFALDTYCTFTVYGDDTAVSQLTEACAHYGKLFDLYDDTSDIARINAASGQPVQVDADTLDLIQQALAFCETTNGLFDISIGAVSTLWNFDEGVRPRDADIAAALPHVGWKNIVVDEAAETICLADPEAKLDLGGIAKGYIADCLLKLLEEKTQATAAVISLGGNIAYFGQKPDGSTWNTGIRDPNDPGGNTTVGTVHLDGGSVVTSGLYERTFELDGVTYWHILDPRTGYPAQTDVTSVSVICPLSTTADALATTLFIAGSADGADIVNSYGNTAAYFIKTDGSTAESALWQELSNFNENS